MIKCTICDSPMHRNSDQYYYYCTNSNFQIKHTCQGDPGKSNFITIDNWVVNSYQDFTYFYNDGKTVKIIPARKLYQFLKQ